MKGLSRQDIENSVKRSSQRKVEPKFENNDATIETQTRRKSQVLGGNLSGINAEGDNKNYTWWIVGSVVVFLFFLVFVLPSFFVERNTLSKAENITVSTDEIYQQTIKEEALNEDSDLAKDNFTKAADRDRALKYREADKTLQKILELELKVQTAIKQGNYTQPNKDNALSYYQQILSLDKRNQKAKKGINYITRRISAVGIEQVNNGDLKSAQASLKSLSFIVDNVTHLDRESSEYIELKNATDKLEVRDIIAASQAAEAAKTQQEISSLLANAKDAFDKKLFTTPENKSALYYYQTLLTKYPDNIDAKQGIQSIIQFYTDKANEHIKNGTWISAQKNIDKIVKVNSSAPEAELLQAYLSTSQSSELSKDLAQEQRALELERQLEQQLKAQQQEIKKLKIQQQELENLKALERRNAEIQAQLREQQIGQEAQQRVQQQQNSSQESSTGQAPVRSAL